jgi:hypothetical protein
MYECIEPRLRSYGWENCPQVVFNMFDLNVKLKSKYSSIENNIIWGDKLKELLGTTVNENNKS